MARWVRASKADIKELPMRCLGDPIERINTEVDPAACSIDCPSVREPERSSRKRKDAGPPRPAPLASYCAPPRWGSPLPREHSAIDCGSPKSKKLERSTWVNLLLASTSECIWPCGARVRILLAKTVRPVALHLREAAPLESPQRKARYFAALVLALCQRPGDIRIVPQVFQEQGAFA